MLSDFTFKPEKSRWRGRALYAKDSVSYGEICGSGYFSTGTKEDGETPLCNFIPEDVNTWGLII